MEVYGRLEEHLGEELPEARPARVERILQRIVERAQLGAHSPEPGADWTRAIDSALFLLSVREGAWVATPKSRARVEIEGAFEGDALKAALTWFEEQTSRQHDWISIPRTGFNHAGEAEAEIKRLIEQETSAFGRISDRRGINELFEHLYRLDWDRARQVAKCTPELGLQAARMEAFPTPHALDTRLRAAGMIATGEPSVAIDPVQALCDRHLGVRLPQLCGEDATLIASDTLRLCTRRMKRFDELAFEVLPPWQQPGDSPERAHGGMTFRAYDRRSGNRFEGVVHVEDSELFEGLVGFVNSALRTVGREERYFLVADAVVMGTTQSIHRALDDGLFDNRIYW